MSDSPKPLQTDLLSLGPLHTNFSEICIKTQQLSCMKKYLKILAVNYWQFFFMQFHAMYKLIGAILFSIVLLGSSSNNARNYFAALMEH